MELFVLSYLESQYFWTTVAFLILLAVMWRLVVPAVLGALDARAARIAGDLDAAERNRVQAEGVLADYTRQLAQAKKEAAEIVTNARAEAEAMVAARTRAVEADLARKAEEARRSIGAAKAEAMRGIQAEVADLAVQVAEKLMKSGVDGKAAKKLTDDALSKSLN